MVDRPQLFALQTEHREVLRHADAISIYLRDLRLKDVRAHARICSVRLTLLLPRKHLQARKHTRTLPPGAHRLLVRETDGLHSRAPDHRPTTQTPRPPGLCTLEDAADCLRRRRAHVSTASVWCSGRSCSS